MAICAKCSATGANQRCGKCKNAYYCSRDCQTRDFKDHKKSCTFAPTSYNPDNAANDTLAMLRRMPNITLLSSSNIIAKVFNTSEIRMAIFSFSPTKELLKMQGVCRLWYRTIALEADLQQRLFFAPGPGKLVFAAGNRVLDETTMAITPRNKKQFDMTKLSKGAGPSFYMLAAPSGTFEEKQAVGLEKAGIPIILIPFFTKLWKQNPKNMTTNPYITLRTTPNSASWRRMQLTSPPILQFDTNVWYTEARGKGNMDRPSTGKIATGVTMGHLADLIATMPSKRKLHWMQPDAYAWWSRSADAVVLPKPYDAGGTKDSMPGVYVNLSNGVAFPGAF